MAEGKYVAYYRVSTRKQGASGLGLEGQKKAVREHLNGGDWELIEEFTEVESGKNNERTELHKALRLCRLTGATLLIAKLDRLSRSVAFLANLRDSGVSFVSCDMPEANSLTIHIMAAVAQDERERISQRTKAALQAAKARGTKLGNPRLSECRNNDTSAARKARQREAQERAMDVLAHIELIKEEHQGDPPLSLRRIASELNRRKVEPPSGKATTWHANTVRRVLKQASATTTA